MKPNMGNTHRIIWFLWKGDIFDLEGFGWSNSYTNIRLFVIVGMRVNALRPSQNGRYIADDVSNSFSTIKQLYVGYNFTAIHSQVFNRQ